MFFGIATKQRLLLGYTCEIPRCYCRMRILSTKSELKVNSADFEKTPQLDLSIDTLVNLIDSIDQPQGVHKIKTTLFSIFLPKLRELQSFALESTNYDYESAEYRVTAIILDTAQYRLFRPVRSDILSTDANTHFIKLDFINKGIDAVICHQF